MMANLQKESRLTLIKQITFGINSRAIYRCNCGTIKEIRISSVKNKSIISCGCYLKEINRVHGLSKHPLYKIWSGIKERCYKTHHPNYYRYGAVGVKMSDDWYSSFKSFYDWAIKNGWHKGLQVDKDIIPNKLGLPALLYSAEMCTIATGKQNNQARHNNVIIEYKGRKESRQYWADLYGINHCTLRDRIKTGKSLDEIFNTPIRRKGCS